MMQRKPGYPVANCSIKMPESTPSSEGVDEEEPPQRRQQLINFGHAQWGFNNWSWAVSKQDLDFVDFSCGKHTAGVAAFVSISIKTLDIHRENVGYGTAIAHSKGLAIHRARKCAVTNALRETLLSFGGTVASELLELDAHKELPVSELQPENNPNLANLANKLPPQPPQSTAEPIVKNIRKDDVAPQRTTCPPAKNAVPALPPVAKALPMPVNLPPAANRPQQQRAPPAAAPAPVVSHPAPQHPAPPHPHAPHPRANSNVSFVVPVVGGVVPPVYAPPRLAAPPQHIFPNAYYEYAGPWHFAYEPHGNVNLNFNIPPKNLVVNGRAGSVECKNACGREGEPQYAGNPNRGCWIKPTIFYDGFWTEQKVKKWVAEQVEKQFPDERRPEPPAPPGSDPPASKP